MVKKQDGILQFWKFTTGKLNVQIIFNINVVTGLKFIAN